MINGIVQTAQIIYKKITVTSLVLFSLLLPLRNVHQSTGHSFSSYVTVSAAKLSKLNIYIMAV